MDNLLNSEQISKINAQINALVEQTIDQEMHLKNVEFKALQNQMNAHFIYNVLESIKMMAEIEEKYEISDATTALGKLLRYTMKWTDRHVTLREEIEYIFHYLKLINLRFDYEVQLMMDLPECIYDQSIPKMSLQPIIENAIYHGFEELSENRTLYMSAKVLKNEYMIEIMDTGNGMSKEMLEKLYQKLEGKIEAHSTIGNGIGLKNVQDRIKMSFGAQYGISIESKENVYTKVKLLMPMTVITAKSGV